MPSQYATLVEFEQLGVVYSSLSNIPTATKTEALQAASGVIDSYLRSRYTLPLGGWGVDITRACCIIATYDLYTLRGYNPNAGGDENIRLRYLDIIKWLEGIAANSVTPDVTDGSTSASSSGGARTYSSSQRGWSRIGGEGGPFSGD